jgi:VanZ family protein
VHSRLWLAVWIGLIVVVVVPWGTLDAHPHWERVAWIPFLSQPRDVVDATANVLFYVPYGILGVLSARKRDTAVRAVMTFAIALALTTEFTQLFSGSRFPSMTDATCNVIGAFVGAQVARRERARRM